LEEQWLLKNLETEKSKYQLAEYAEQMNKDLLVAQGEVASLRQLLAQYDLQLQNTKDTLSRELTDIQTELSEKQQEKLQFESQVEQQKMRVDSLEEELGRISEEVTIIHYS
jgi:chromosome segregation ATPase